MKHHTVLLGLFVLLLSAPAFCQQNFFNVPSTDITPQGKLFFQQQLNFTVDAIQSSTTFCYGVGHDAEFGINVIGVTYDHHEGLTEERVNKPYYPYYSLNMQKKFTLRENLALGIGTQLGTTRQGKGGGYLYADGVYLEEKTKTKVVGGLYYTSDSYFGAESRGLAQHGSLRKVGVQAGIEQNLWKDRLFLQSDFISGKHALGEVVVGGAGYLNKHWVLSAGYQVPTFHSKSLKAVVLEMTFVPK